MKRKVVTAQVPPRSEVKYQLSTLNWLGVNLFGKGEHKIKTTPPPLCPLFPTFSRLQGELLCHWAEQGRKKREEKNNQKTFHWELINHRDCCQNSHLAGWSKKHQTMKWVLSWFQLTMTLNRSNCKFSFGGKHLPSGRLWELFN